MVSESSPYVGRFAPSPTGPLHFGSLLAAVASYLEAIRHDGRWYVRIDDIDPPREQPGAADGIISTLAAYGFEWHGDVIFQSRSAERHRAALEQLLENGHAYPCGCSRRDIADAPGGPLGQIYPGTCRAGTTASEFAYRVRTIDTPVVFQDSLQGPQELSLESQSGDFVIFRRDSLVAYQLAVVVDDAALGVTHIVRGIDLMPSTPRQIWLQQLLHLQTPIYAHIPVAVHADGEKLSKLTGAPGIPVERPEKTLLAALLTLEQAPPATLSGASLQEVWSWAEENWDMQLLSSKTAIQRQPAAS
ncbi:MAG: tRNA glutamyl-Q(34) synthetase GluQRS [Woeseiaceae bacterium]|nr:tRNA glutamyl-Q(34) synthetase GluQRS [Woeseiaceae bacterium]